VLNGINLGTTLK